MSAKQDAARDRTDWARERTLLAIERRLLGRVRIGLVLIGLALAIKAPMILGLETRVVQAIIVLLILAAIGVFFSVSKGANSLASRQSGLATGTLSGKHISILAHTLSISTLFVGAILLWL